MGSYATGLGVDTGVRSTANSADVRGNVHLRLALGGEAGILVEEPDPSQAGPRFVAIYFPAEELGVLIRHLQAMRDEYASHRGSRRCVTPSSSL
jgi:hypothetical protein